MAIVSSSTRLSAGAGRSLSYRLNDFSQVSGTVGANGVVRPGAGISSIASSTTQGAPPAQGTLERKGIRCWSFGSAAAGAGIAWLFNQWLQPMRNAALFPNGLTSWNVYEIRALLSFDRPAGDLNDGRDLGVCLSPGNNNANMNNPAVGAVFRAGAQFGPGGPGKLRFRTRVAQTGVGPPPYSADFDTLNTVPTGTLAGYDEREWHWYALRLIGGAANTPGVCKAMLDGITFSQVNMDDTTAKFPNPQSGVGGAFGYHFGVTNQTNAEFDFMYIAMIEQIMAPTETDM